MIDNVLTGARFSKDRPVTRVLHDSEQMRVVSFCLSAGQVIEPHYSPSRVLMQVVSGTGTLTVGDNVEPVGPGSVAVCEPMEAHGMSANEDMVIVAVIAPSPA